MLPASPETKACTEHRYYYRARRRHANHMRHIPRAPLLSAQSSWGRPAKGACRRAEWREGFRVCALAAQPSATKYLPGSDGLHCA